MAQEPQTQVVLTGEQQAVGAQSTVERAPWHRPAVTRINIMRTMMIGSASGVGRDLGTFTGP